MKIPMKKTRHFRLNEETDAKLMEVCALLNESPSAVIRSLIASYQSQRERNAVPVQTVGRRATESVTRPCIWSGT